MTINQPSPEPEPLPAVRLYGADLTADPAELYRSIRQRYGPVAPVLLDGEIPGWLVLGYRELHLVTTNSQLFARDSRRWDQWDRIPPDWPLMPYVGWTPSLMFTEGPEHRRRAGAVGDALDGIDRTDLASICEKVADRLIDAFAGRGSADLVTEYASQIPMLVVAKLFGIPEADIPAMVSEVAGSLQQNEGAVAAFQALFARMQALVKEKRDRPTRDVPSLLIADPAGLADDEIVNDMIIIVAAAQAPTSTWIANTLRLMLLDDQFSLTLQGGRSSASQALNEVLWKDTPTQNMIGRWAAQDCELGGQRIHQGDLLILGLAGANADSQVQPQSHGESAANRAHMSFSHGEHGCPFPAPELAEVIARVGVETLLDRIPDVQLAVPPEELPWLPSVWIRAMEGLPVSFTPITDVMADR